MGAGGLAPFTAVKDGLDSAITCDWKNPEVSPKWVGATTAMYSSKFPLTEAACHRDRSRLEH